MSMSVTPVELVLYVEFVAAVHDHHRRDPGEREEKTLHSVARMMSADSTRTIQGISDELAASKMLIQELLELLRDARGLLTNSGLLEHGRRGKPGRHRSCCLPRRSIDWRVGVADITDPAALMGTDLPIFTVCS